ncbi:MAG: ABC transporter ATP-binding protein [Betaproteobacteria bacterium]|nr:MAG: ABC transporter ATP-binding protein [Betaproteobacteria bacterium]
MLVVDGVSKSFARSRGEHGRLLVLDGISFAVRDHEFVSVLGPSGCGKTTLIRILVGLVPPDSGEIHVDGRRVAGPGPDRCMVFQNSGLLPWRTVQANVEFGLEVLDMDAPARAVRAGQYIELVGLKGFERYFPHEISGGMQQRVGIARALARDPKILLMDEPFGAIDAQTREQLQEELLRIWAETRKTVLFVTHSIDEAVFLSDRIVLLEPHPGRVARVIDVPLPRPRLSLDVQDSPAFAAVRHEIRGALRAMRALKPG